MLILNSNKDCIHNSEYIQRITISAKDDGVYLICAAISMREPLITLGRYYSQKNASEVLIQLFSAMAGGAQYFEMPLQSDVNEEERKRDTRTKRKGGS